VPWVCQSRRNLIAWADPERIYIAKSTLGFEKNPKEFVWVTNVRCTLLSQLSLDIFHELLVECVFFLNVEVQTSRLFLTITSMCRFHSRIQTQKQNYSFLDPHGFYWVCNVVRGNRVMKERIREAQRVFKGDIE